MIVENSRDELGFVEAVTDLFRFLETQYGCRQIHADPTRVTYKSPDIEINVWHDPRSYEIEFYVAGGRGSHGWKYGLPAILKALVPGYQDSGFYQTSDKHLLRQSLADIAGLIRKHADPLLSGSEDALRRMEAIQQEAGRRWTEEYAIAPVKEKAYVAWKEHHYEEMIDLYVSIEAHLTSLEQKRLEYARKHIQGTRGHRDSRDL